MRCEDVADQLAVGADDARQGLGPAGARHVEQCLRCQAELVQYRKLLRALRALRTEVLAPAPGLLNDVLTSIEEEVQRQAIGGAVRGRRTAYVSGIAAATAAAAGGAIVLAARNRRRFKLAS